MKRLRICIFALILLTVTLEPSQASRLSKKISKRGVVMWEQTNFANAAHVLSLRELKAKIDEVKDEPCSMYFGRTIMKNPSSGFLGVVTGVLGVRVAMDHEVKPEEGGMDKAFFVKPADRNDWASWIDYFKGRVDSDGSRDMATALLLRRKARILKFEMFLEDRLGKGFDALSDGDIDSLRSESEYRWLVNDIFEPVTIILKPKLQTILWKNQVDTGPAFGPLPSLNLLPSADLSEGHDTVKGCVVDAQGRFVVRRTDSVVLLSDIEKIFEIDKAIARDSLGDVVGHELFHGIMSDLYGVDAPGGAKSKSRMGHDAHVISDYSMALSEGWAEFFEAWTGIDNPSFDNSGGKAEVTRFLLGRQVPIRRNLYTQADFEKFRSTKKTGRIKTGSQMEATEGLVAGILYSILTHDDISAPFELILEAMYREKPQTMTELISAMMKRAPSDRERRIIALTYLYDTKFATVSVEAWRLYQNMYSAKLAFVRGKNEGLDASTVASLRDAFSSARYDYKDFVSELASKVLSGELPLDSNVGPELWMDGLVSKEVDGEEKEITFRFNLNTATESLLRAIGFEPGWARAIVESRDAIGYCESVQDLRGAVPREVIELLGQFRSLHAKGWAN